MAWYDTQTTSDEITHTEWNNMADVIEANTHDCTYLIYKEGSTYYARSSNVIADSNANFDTLFNSLNTNGVHIHIACSANLTTANMNVYDNNTITMDGGNYKLTLASGTVTGTENEFVNIFTNADQVNGNTNIRLIGLNIDMNGDNQPVETDIHPHQRSNAIFFKSVDESLIKDCTIDRAVGSAIWWWNGFRNKVENNILKRAGIQRIGDDYQDHRLTGLYCENWHHGIIANNHVWGCYSCGIVTEVHTNQTSEDEYSHDNTIIGNVVSGCAVGIYLEESRDSSIIGNTSSYNTRDEAYVANAAAGIRTQTCINILVQGNTCVGNGDGSPGGANFWASGRYNSWIGNTSRNSNGQGFYITSDDSTLIGNTSVSDADDGIYYEAQNPNIQSNTIKEAGDHGIFAYEGAALRYPGSGGIVSNNIIHNSTDHGILVRYNNIVINNNNVINSGADGIETNDCSGSTINGNIVISGATNGIIFDGLWNVVCNNRVTKFGGTGILEIVNYTVCVGNYASSNRTANINVDGANSINEHNLS